MSCMSQNFRLFHVSNLSVRNFRMFLLMYTGSQTARPPSAVCANGQRYGRSRKPRMTAVPGMAAPRRQHRPTVAGGSDRTTVQWGERNGTRREGRAQRDEQEKRLLRRQRRRRRNTVKSRVAGEYRRGGRNELHWRRE